MMTSRPVHMTPRPKGGRETLASMPLRVELDLHWTYHFGLNAGSLRGGKVD